MDSNDVRRTWADRTGEYSPAYYAHYGPDETSEAIERVFQRHLDQDSSVLELGFGSGRHLSHLNQHGYNSLTGVDVNDDALAVMADAYPELADQGTFHVAAIGDVIGDFSDDQFDAVFSVETLQHVHPAAEWAFADLHRITGDLLVTVENESEDDRADGSAVTYVDEGLPLYHRDWNAVFSDAGFVEIESRSIGRDTLRAFRPSASGMDADHSV